MPPWSTPGLESALILSFAFLIGHALGDYPLQTAFMARGKNRHLSPPCPELPVRGLWVYCLTAHALTHAGIVWVISGQVAFAAVEFFLHWVIDFCKAEKKISFHLDQALHLACKAGYVVLLLR